MEFRTRKDGTVYPLAGGSGKKKTGAGTAFAGVVLAGVIGIGGGGGAVGGGAAAVEGLGGAAQVRVVNAQKAAARGQRGEAWKRLGVRELRRVARPAVNCAVNSYGQVREFFLARPCRSLDRALLALGDGRGGSLVLSVYWVRMPGRSAARALRRLADTYGTGNVAPLAGALLELGDVRYTGRYYHSRIAGTLVVIAETEALTGAPGGEVSESVAQVAVYLPRV